MAALSDSNKRFGESAGGLGDQLNEIGGKLGIQLPDEATKALNGIEGLSAGSVAAMAAAAAAVAGFVEVCKKLHQITMEAAHDVDALVTKSMTTGVSTEMLQQWQYASEFIDVSVETMTGSLTKLTNSMYDANNGNDALASTFQKLGVDITDSSGQLRDAEDVFMDVIDALGEVGNQTERDAIAMDVFGRSAQELNPLILQGSDALRELAEEAEETGYVLDEDQIKKLAAVDDAYQKAQLQVETFKKQLALEFAPASKAAMETFEKVVEKAGKMLVDSGLIKGIATVVEGVMGIIDVIADFTDLIPGWMNPIKQLSDAFYAVGLVLAGVADALQLVIGLMPANWGSGMVSSALGFGYSSGNANHLQRAQMAHAGTLDMYDEFYAGRNAVGNDNWRGGLTWVGEAGPELVSLPRGSQILNAQDSRGMTGGQVININVQGIQQLDEIVSWYESRRVRGRMA